MGTPAGNSRMGFRRRALWALAAAGLWVGGAMAQEPVRIAPIEQPVRPVSAITAEYIGRTDGGVIQAQCSSCASVPRDLPPPSYDACGGNCVAGGHCCRCENETGFGRLYCHLYNAFQCPDPCYEPGWVAGANASLFVDTARPATQMMFRYDRGSTWSSRTGVSTSGPRSAEEVAAAGLLARLPPVHDVLRGWGRAVQPSPKCRTGPGPPTRTAAGPGSAT